MQDFDDKEIQKLSDEMHGQEINQIRKTDDGMDDYLEISLKDGRTIRFRYDWIYEFEIKGN